MSRADCFRRLATYELNLNWYRSGVPIDENFAFELRMPLYLQTIGRVGPPMPAVPSVLGPEGLLADALREVTDALRSVR